MYEDASAQALPDLNKGSIALWESTLLTVFELVVDNIPLVVDA